MGLFISIGAALSVGLLLLDMSDIFNVSGGLFTILKPLLYGTLIDLVIFILFAIFMTFFNRK